MGLSARELQQIKGIGAVLSVRLLEAGYDSFAKIVKLGESGLKEIKGINQKAVPDIIAQAERLNEECPGARDEKVAVLNVLLQGLRQSVQELTIKAKERFNEKLAGRTGRKLTDALVDFIDAVETLENKAGKKLKRSGKAVFKAQQRLEGLAESGLKELLKGLRKARKALQRVHE